MEKLFYEEPALEMQEIESSVVLCTSGLTAGGFDDLGNPFEI